MLIFGDEGTGKTTLVETIGAQLIEHNSVVKFFQIEHCSYRFVQPKYIPTTVLKRRIHNGSHVPLS